MKKLMRICFLSGLIVCFLSLSVGLAGDTKSYSPSPSEKPSKKWRLGYLEGGPYKNYPIIFLATIEGLVELGWIEKMVIPSPKDKQDTGELWAWLAAHAKSSYVEFVPDAYYSNQWDSKLREKTKKALIARLNKKKDIDLMIAVGTWAGQDLANNEHSVPTMVCSVTDPIASKIIKSVKDSGYDHIHAKVDPTRYERQVRTFHDIIGFKKLGVSFENTTEGRSYAAIGSIEKIAKERNFELVPCHLKRHDVSPEEAEAQLVKCVDDLAGRIDAYYHTEGIGANDKSLVKIVESLMAHKIPSFSQAGSKEVGKGILLSVARPSPKGLGRFHGGVIGKIINGASPRQLDLVYENPMRISLNKSTAKAIDMKGEIYNFLLETADEIFEKIEKP